MSVARASASFSLAPEDESLFLRLGDLRAAPSAALYTLELSKRYSSIWGGAGAHLARLVEQKYLARYGIAGTRYRVLHLTRKALDAFPSVGARFSEHVGRTPTDEVAARGWIRSSLLAALVSDGFVVGRDLKALTALRRHLIDRQEALIAERSAQGASVRAEAVVRDALRASHRLRPHIAAYCDACGVVEALDSPKGQCSCGATLRREIVTEPWRCSKCEHVATVTEPHLVLREDIENERLVRLPVECRGTLRPSPYLPFDVAYRAGDLLVVLADDPCRSIRSQLRELPLRVPGQPRLKLVLRHADDASLFDPETKTWVVRGPRLRQLEHAFNPRGASVLFPFWETADVLDYRPELQFRVLPKRRRHEEEV